MAWWEFRPRKKKFSPPPPIPPQIPRKHPPGRRHPPHPHPPGRPLFLGFSIKNPPPPLPAPWTPPSPDPSRKKIKNIRNVHQDGNGGGSRTVKNASHFGENLGTCFVRKFVPQHKSFGPTWFCRHATLTLRPGRPATE